MANDNIAMNYGELDSMLSTFDRQIDDLCGADKDFFAAVDVTREYWKGTTAEGSIQSIYEFKPKLDDLVNLIVRYRNAISTARNNHQEAENENIQRARNMEF